MTWRRVRDTREKDAASPAPASLTILISFAQRAERKRGEGESERRVIEWALLAGQFNFFATRVSSATRELRLASATDLFPHTHTHTANWVTNYVGVCTAVCVCVE